METRRFWEVWANMNWTLNTLRTLLTISIVSNIVLGVVLIKKISEKKPVIVVPAELRTVSEIQPDVIPDQVKKDIGVYLVNLYASFSPANIQLNIQDILRFVDAESYGKVKALLVAQAQKVAQSGYSQYFQVTNTLISGDTVNVSGVLKIYLGDQVIKEDRSAKYYVVFKQGEKNSANPYGIYLAYIGTGEGGE